MNFYRISTRKTKSSPVVDSEFTRKCRENTEFLYRNSDEKILAVIEEIKDFTCTIIAVVKHEVLPEFDAGKLVLEINSLLGLDLRIKRIEEISLYNFKRSLRTAEFDRYIDDYSEIESDFNLRCNLNFDEAIAEKKSRKNIKELAKQLLCEKSLIPEIERIYKIKNESGTICHPVHYIVKANDEDYKEVVNSLISALYENKRVDSRRYSEITMHQYINFSRHNYYQLYELHRGGTVVINVEGEDHDDGDFSRNGVCNYVESLMAVVNKFSKDVLTIFVLPLTSEKVVNTVYKYADPLFMEIKTENVSGESAKEYLRYKARKEKVNINDSLFKGISDKKSYSATELSERFLKWYSDYRRSELYPQYAEFERKEVTEEESYSGEALKELDEMIGLDNAKKIVHDALDFYKVQSLYKQLGKKANTLSMHMVFTGNPGTAKTTVARLFAQILKDNNILSSGRLVEVGRADLIGKYVGHTAPLVQRAFEEASGGVLFIDEAYSLLDDRSNMYGDEAINTIVQEMENRRDELIVIFAGYPREMEEFLSRNPGLKSRIAFHVPFDDYSSEELCDIALLMAKNKKNTITDAAVDKLREIFAQTARSSDFGNGRYVRNIMEKAEMKRASRLAKLDFNDVTKEMIETFTEEDFEIEGHEKKERHTIGFIRSSDDI